MFDDEQLKETRGMVLAFAAGTARRCVEAVESGGLRMGQMTDEVEAGGMTWHIMVVFDADDETLRINGHPVEAEADEEAEMEHPFHAYLARMFGHGEAGEGSFDFRLPLAWLPTGVPTIQR